MEGGYIIGLKQNGQSVTLEPGGQFELSGGILESLHQTCAEVNNHLYQVRSVSEELGIGFLGAGFDPKWRFEDVPRMPKERCVCIGVSCRTHPMWLASTRTATPFFQLSCFP